MKRYHKEVYIPISLYAKAIETTEKLNTLQWKCTSHTADNIKGIRYIDLVNVLEYIKGLQLRQEDIFEIWEGETEIEKLCYRVNWKTEIDLILVVGKNKELVTVYINDSKDNHETLKKELYEA